VSRAFPASAAAAFIQPNVSVVTFAMLDFASGIIRVHNSIGTYTWGGFDWLGVGDFGEISKLEEGADISPYGIVLTLSGLDINLMSVALTQDYFRRPAEIYIGALSADDELLGEPLIMWAGYMDVMSVSAGDDNNAVTINCESELQDFEKSSNLKYTTQTQQGFHTGDIFFDFLPEIEGAKIRWRDSNSDSIAGSPSDRRNRGSENDGSQYER
jgi:hypothetical protein